MVISCHCRICPISVCTHFVECPCQAVAQQGIVKLHLYQHGIHGGGQSFQFQRFVLLRKYQPSLCHAPVWKVQTIGVMVHLRIFVFISDLFGIYNQFPFFPADAWCRAVYHVSDLQHEVVEVVRFSSVELEADHAAVVFYQLVHQGGVCPLAVEPLSPMTTRILVSSGHLLNCSTPIRRPDQLPNRPYVGFSCSALRALAERKSSSSM